MANKRGAQGGGNIRKKTVTRNGKTYTYWEARVTVGHDAATGAQIQRSFTGSTQKEVREKLQAVAVELNQGTYIAPSKMTVGEWLDIWTENYLGGVKPKTVVSYTGHIRNHLKPAFGAIPLQALNPHTIQRFYNTLSSEKDGKPALSPKTVLNIHGVLHKALQQAVKIGYLRSNPTDACELPRAEQREIHPLGDAEISRFLEAIQGHRFETLFLVALFTGLRRGELAGLLWSDIDLERGTISVNKQLQNIDGQPGEYRFISAKNGKGRTITAAPFIVERLKKHKIQQAEKRLKAGPLWNDKGFVFTDEVGNNVSPCTVYHCFKRIAASIGIPNARFHDLRHSYAVAALKSGDDIKTVQTNLGHHTAGFTLTVYGHCTEEMQIESARRMERYIKTVSNL